MIETICQIWILIFGCLAIWFVSRREHWMRWGYIFGLIGQPVWVYVTFVSEQWGMFLLTWFYVYSWSQGIYNYWIRKEN